LSTAGKFAQKKQPAFFPELKISWLEVKYKNTYLSRVQADWADIIPGDQILEILESTLFGPIFENLWKPENHVFNTNFVYKLGKSGKTLVTKL